MTNTNMNSKSYAFLPFIIIILNILTRAVLKFAKSAFESSQWSSVGQPYFESECCFYPTARLIDFVRFCLLVVSLIDFVCWLFRRWFGLGVSEYCCSVSSDKKQHRLTKTRKHKEPSVATSGGSYEALADGKL